jgi:hypothetical protein
MQKQSGAILKTVLTVFAAACILSVVCAGWALDGKSVARLKKAGVSDQTLEQLAQERTLETGAFSVDEIVAMKAAGIGEEALQTLISEGSFMKDREPVVYGDHLRSIRLSSAEDIIALKKAGLSDDVLRAIVALNRSSSDADREEALRLLTQMGIWVDSRR